MKLNTNSNDLCHWLLVTPGNTMDHAKDLMYDGLQRLVGTLALRMVTTNNDVHNIKHLAEYLWHEIDPLIYLSNFR